MGPSDLNRPSGSKDHKFACMTKHCHVLHGSHQQHVQEQAITFSNLYHQEWMFRLKRSLEVI